MDHAAIGSRGGIYTIVATATAQQVTALSSGEVYLSCQVSSFTGPTHAYSHSHLMIISVFIRFLCFALD